AFLGRQFDRGGAIATADGTVTSESQAYALLRAVLADDRDAFTRTWTWSKAHLLDGNGLLAWKWKGTVVDSHSAADADTDAALALLMAGRRWSNAEWLADGTLMVRALWRNDVAIAGDRVYVTGGDWAPQVEVVLAVNPSY